MSRYQPRIPQAQPWEYIKSPEEEAKLDRENIEGMRDLMDTLYYLQHEQKTPLPPELVAEVKDLIKLYGAVYGHRKKVA